MGNRVKKIFALIMTFAFVAGAFFSYPIPAKAASVTLPAQIYVGSDMLYYSSENMWRTVGSGWKYNKKTNTLYLHGSFSSTYPRTYSVVRVEGDINIVVDGPTIINNEENYILGIYVAGNCNLTIKNNLTIKAGAGIVVEEGNLTITGKGKTAITATGSLYGGIYASGVALTSSSRLKTNLTMKNIRDLKVKSKTLYGIHANAGNIQIKNCKLDVTGYVGGIAAFYGDVSIQGKKLGNDITVKAEAASGAAISVVKKNNDLMLGCDKGKGTGKIKIGKKVFVKTPTTPYKFKTTAKIKYPIVKYQASVKKENRAYITLKLYTFTKNGKISKKIVIR